MQAIAVDAVPIFPIDVVDRKEAVSILMASLRTSKNRRTINGFLKTLLSMESLNLRERQLAAGGSIFPSSVNVTTAVNGAMNTAAVVREAMKYPKYLEFLESIKMNEDYGKDAAQVSIDAFRFLPLDDRIRFLTGKGDRVGEPILNVDRIAEAVALLDAARVRAIEAENRSAIEHR